jgi:hypothetical protein
MKADKWQIVTEAVHSEVPFFPIRILTDFPGHKKPANSGGSSRVRTCATYTELPTENLRLVAGVRAGQSSDVKLKSRWIISNGQTNTF